MKQSILAISILCYLTLLVSCGQQKAETISEQEQALEERISEVDPESVGLLKGSEIPMFDPYSCDSNFIYGNMEICLEAHSDYNGNILSVVDYGTNTNFKLCEDYGCFFKGLIEEKLIIDTGTGSVRGLELYNLNGEKAFSGNYVNELSLVDDSIIFWNQVDIAELDEKPACAENWEGDPATLGFIEEYSLNLITLEVSKTGKTDCQYLE